MGWRCFSPMSGKETAMWCDERPEHWFLNVNLYNHRADGAAPNEHCELSLWDSNPKHWRCIWDQGYPRSGSKCHGGTLTLQRNEVSSTMQGKSQRYVKKPRLRQDGVKQSYHHLMLCSVRLYTLCELPFGCRFYVVHSGDEIAWDELMKRSCAWRGTPVAPDFETLEQ